MKLHQDLKGLLSAHDGKGHLYRITVGEDAYYVEASNAHAALRGVLESIDPGWSVTPVSKNDILAALSAGLFKEK